MYYLNSRYYDANTGRFINADGMVTTGQGLSSHNMFTYCGNNPVIRSDPSGESFLDVLFYCTLTVVVCAAVVLAAPEIALVTGGIIAASTIASAATAVAYTATAVAYTATAVATIEAAKEISKPVSISIAQSKEKTKQEVDGHHIVAKKAARAEPAREVLKSVGIDINDVQNLVTLPRQYHQSLHTNAYYDYVNFRLAPYYGDKKRVENTLNELRCEILLYSSMGIRWD